MDDHDYTDAERIEAWHRAQEQLADADAIREQLAQRAAYNRGEAIRRSALEAQVPHPVQRPVRSGRDWHAEGLWVRQLAEQVVETKLAAIADGIGQVVAQERAAHREALDTLRAEMTRELDALRDKVTTVADLQRCIEGYFQRLDRLIITTWPSDTAFTGRALAPLSH